MSSNQKLLIFSQCGVNKSSSLSPSSSTHCSDHLHHHYPKCKRQPLLLPGLRLSPYTLVLYFLLLLTIITRRVEAFAPLSVVGTKCIGTFKNNNNNNILRLSLTTSSSSTTTTTTTTTTATDGSNEKLSSTRRNDDDDDDDDDDDTLPLPPFPDPTANPEDDFYRNFRRKVPKFLQSWMRDSGTGRTISDGLVWLAVPALLQEKGVGVLMDFIKVTIGSNTPLFSILSSILVEQDDDDNNNNNKDGNKNKKSGLLSELDLMVERISYGTNKRQFVSMITTQKEQQQRQCETDDNSNTINNNIDNIDNDNDNKDNDNYDNRIVVFVHGGAWGSGFPSMYALTATPFLTKNNNAGYPSVVAMVGYRTFPSVTTITEQVDDIARALDAIVDNYYYKNKNDKDNSSTTVPIPPPPKITLIGHSSGAHLLAMGFLQRRFNLLDSSIDQFIGMAGVYNIYSHYEFEKGRGVERISAMAKICGSSAAQFRANSPTYIAAAAAAAAAKATTSADQEQQQQQHKQQTFFPKRSILLHGSIDTTVSYQCAQDLSESSSGEVPWKLLNGVGHAEMVLELMFGGTTSDFILNWMDEK